MKCSNCSEDAKYVYPRGAGFELFFCRKHLPKFLSAQAKQGLLQDATSFVATKTITKKIKESIKVEEPVIEEEPTVEEMSSEEE